MALGLLAGALSGGGEAMQNSAMLELQKRKKEALARVDHEQDMSRQNDQQEFASNERKAGQEFAAGQSQLDRQHSARITKNKGLLGGAMTDIQKEQTKYLSGQIEAIDKQLYGADSAMLSDEQKAQLEIQRNESVQQLEGILGMSGSGGNLVDELAGMRSTLEEARRPTLQDDVSAVQQTRQNERVQQMSEEQRNQMEEELGQIDSQIDRIIRPLSNASRIGNPLNGGMGMSGEERAREGQDILQRLDAMYNNPQISDFQRRQIREQLDKLASAGVDISATISQ